MLCWAEYNDDGPKLIALEPLNYVGKGNSIMKAKYWLGFSKQCVKKPYTPKAAFETS
jgi:hypothetical protein